MKKRYSIFLSAFLFVFAVTVTRAQDKNASQTPFYLGNVPGLLNQLQKQSNTPAGRGMLPKLNLRVSASKSFSGKVNYKRAEQITGEYFIGEIENVPASSFYIRINGTSMEGNIVLRATKQAYKYSSDEKGNAYVTEEDINKVLCIDFDEHEHARSSTNSGRVEALAASPAVLNFQSFPGAKGCVLLDFDGQYVSGTPWNNGNPIDAQPSAFTDAQITEIWEIISEDFRPFNMNITTSEAVFNTYPKSFRMRCIFTPTNTAAPGSGGVAYVGSFRWNDDTPCWAYNSGTKSAGETGSHEVGHTLGLRHDGRISPATSYYSGHGSWGPIMGAPFNKPVVQWSKGEYASANNTEDDLAIITSPTYNIGYRTDDFGSTITAASLLPFDATGKVLTSGVIETNSDADVFSFNTTGGNLALTITPAKRHGNLDILATLYNSAGTAIATSNPTGLTASLAAPLAAGKYYISLTGTGAGSPLTDGYSKYGSLGIYTISGTIPSGVPERIATFYSGCNYDSTTYAAGLELGSYTTAQLIQRRIANNSISSLKIKSGYEVVLYKNDNFTGDSAIFRTNNSCLTGNFNDSTSSLKIRLAPIVNASAIFYAGCNYDSTTYGVGLATGNYTRAQLALKGIPDNTISSFKIKGGFEVVLFKRDNFTGDSTVFRTSTTCLTTAFNDSTSSLKIRPFVNQTPQVSITSPANGTTFVAPATITINASASDSDGTIARVEFFRGTAKIGEDLTAPYSFTVTNVTEGSYTFQVRATDNLGAQRTSSSRNVQVGPLAATVYKYCNYTTTGFAVNVAPGTYTLSQMNSLGIPNNDISALKVRSGYEIVLYGSSNLTGTSYTFKGEVPCLTSVVVNGATVNFNNQASSLIVRVSSDSTLAALASGVDLQERHVAEQVTMAPNPVVDRMTVDFDHSSSEFAQVEVFNIHRKEALPVQKVKSGEQIDMSNLTKGLYFVRVNNGKNVVIKRIIKH